MAPKGVRFRSYQMDVVSRLDRLRKKHWSLCKIGDLKLLSSLPVYPCFAVMSKSRQKDTRPWILISGGVHGDEHAGVFAVFDFLENHAYKYAKKFRFLAYPCVNPTGFELGTEENVRGQDVNHSFTDISMMQEVRFIREHLESLGLEFLFTVDMHEAMPKDKFFLWEVCPNKNRRVGRDIVRAVKKIAPVHTKRFIYGDRNSGGVIFYPEGQVGDFYDEVTTF